MHPTLPWAASLIWKPALSYAVGWRRYQTLPVYAIEDNNGRYRYDLLPAYKPPACGYESSASVPSLAAPPAYVIGLARCTPCPVGFAVPWRPDRCGMSTP